MGNIFTLRNLTNRLIKEIKNSMVFADGSEVEFDSGYEYFFEDADRELNFKELDFDVFPDFMEAMDEILPSNWGAFLGVFSKHILVTTNLSGDKAVKFNGIIYSPIIPRDWRASSPEDYLDLGLRSFNVEKEDKLPEKVDFIVTRHDATCKILKNFYPNAVILSGPVDEDLVKNKVVAGVLPPNLIASCKSFVKFTVKNYNANNDGDMSALELQQRGFDMTHIKVLEVKGGKNGRIEFNR